MTGIVVVSVLCAAGMAFMGWFLLALHRERQSGGRSIAQVMPYPRVAKVGQFSGERRPPRVVHMSHGARAAQSVPARSERAMVGSK
jgi:hypothetical protein